jgi:hypothetical protein
MSDLEQLLKAARMSAPSSALDRRIEEMFAAAEERLKPSRTARCGWWLAILAPLGAATALLLVSSRSQSEPLQPVTYQFIAQGPMLQFLIEPPISATPLPHFVTRAQPP